MTSSTVTEAKVVASARPYQAANRKVVGQFLILLLYRRSMTVGFGARRAPPQPSGPRPTQGGHPAQDRQDACPTLFLPTPARVRSARDREASLRSAGAASRSGFGPAIHRD